MWLPLRALVGRPLRTVLTILGVAVGVACVVGLTGIAAGFRAGMDRYARETGADLVVFQAAAAVDPTYGRLTARDLAALRALDGVRSVGATAAVPVLLPGDDRPLLLIGRDPGEEPLRAYDNPMLRGGLITRSDQAMLGSLAAETLGLDLGDALPVLDAQLAVVGIYQTGVRWENAAAVVHIDQVRHSLGLRQGAAMMAFVYLDRPEETVAASAALSGMLPHLRSVPASLLTAGFPYLEWLDAFAWIVAAGALLTGAITVANTLAMSVSERTAELGVLRAFGFSPTRLVGLVLQEALLLGLVGAVAGCLLGMVAAEVLVRLVPPGALLQASWPLSVLLRGAAVGVSLAVLGALPPAWRVSRLDPAEALRRG